MEELSHRLRKWSPGWVALLTLLVFVVFSATVLPAQAELARQNSAGAGTPDLSFFYTPSQLYSMAEAYGAEGRLEYVRARFTFDVIWPVVYTVFLVATISWLYKNSFPPGSRWQLANLLPLFGALFDFFENSFTSLVMLRYPALTPGVDWLASLSTSLKWILIGASSLALVLGLVVFVGRAIWRKPAVKNG